MRSEGVEQRHGHRKKDEKEEGSKGKKKVRIMKTRRVEKNTGK